MSFQNITDEEGNLILGQDGNPIGFGEDHIHLLRHEIHGTFDTGYFADEAFEHRIVALGSGYPYEDSQNYHMYVHAIQELNKKLDKFGLTDQIIQPVDAGFRPLDLDNFFLGLADFLRLENGSYILQENGYKIILQQDIDLENGFELLQENGFKLLTE